MKTTEKKNANALPPEKKKIDKENVKKLTDEELNKVAGGLWCEPGCYPVLNGCQCDDW